MSHLRNSIKKLTLSSTDRNVSSRSTARKLSESDDEKVIIHKANQKSPPTSSRKSGRSCLDCKNPAQAQCLHCSKDVCLNCMKRHVDSATHEVDLAHQFINEKFTVLDEIAVNGKEMVNMKHEILLKEVESQRIAALDAIDDWTIQQKTKIRDKSNELTKLPLDAVSNHIKRMRNDLAYIDLRNSQVLIVSTESPRISISAPHFKKRNRKESSGSDQ